MLKLKKGAIMKANHLTILIAAAFYGNLQHYAAASPTYNADNTAENVRDRNGQEVTPQDQSNRKSAIRTTAALRKAIMHTKGLSVNAQNIKIIDKNGCVTLRGPVDTEQEKLIIEDLARQHCGDKFRSELEIKTQ